MKKKTLVSILAMTSAPMAAYADAVVDNIKDDAATDWSGAKDLTLEEGVLVSPSGTTVEKNIGILVKGTYSLTTGKGTENAKISLVGATLAEDGTFTLESDTDITLKIEAEKAGQFTVAGLELKLKVDLVTEYKNPLTIALAKAADKINDALTGEQKEAFQNEISAISGEIAQIKNDEEGTYDLYKKYELYNGWENSTINREINTLKTNIENAGNNAAAYNASLALHNEKNTALENAIKVFNGIADDSDKAYAEQQAASARETAKNLVDKFLDDIEQAKTDKNAAEVCPGLDEAFKKVVDRAIGEYENTVNAAVTNNQAYVAVNAAIEAQKKVYNEALQAIYQALEGITDEKVNLREQAQSELNIIYLEILEVQKNNGTAENHNESDAKKEANLSALQAAGEKIAAKQTEWTEKAATLNQQYAAALALLKEVQGRFDGIKEVGPIKNMTERTEKIQTLIDDLEGKIEADNAKHEFSDYTEQENAINAEIDELIVDGLGSEANYKAYEAADEAIDDLVETLRTTMEKVNALKSEDGGYVVNGKFATDETTFNETINGYRKAIDAALNEKADKCQIWWADNQVKVNATEAAIKALETTANDCVASYTAITKGMAGLKASLDELDKKIGSDTDVPVYEDGQPSDETYGGKYDKLNVAYDELVTAKAEALAKESSKHSEALKDVQNSVATSTISTEAGALVATFDADKAAYDKDVVENTVTKLLAQADKKIEEGRAKLTTWTGEYNLGNTGKVFKDLLKTKNELAGEIEKWAGQVEDERTNPDKAAAMSMLTTVNTKIGEILGKITTLNKDSKDAKDAFDASNKAYDEDFTTAYKAQIIQLYGDGKDITGVLGLNEDQSRTTEFEDSITKQKAFLDGQKLIADNSKAAETMADDWTNKIKPEMDKIAGNITALREAAEASTANWNEYDRFMNTDPTKGLIASLKIADNIEKAKTDITNLTTADECKAVYNKQIEGYNTQFGDLKTNIETAYAEPKRDIAINKDTYKFEENLTTLNNNINGVIGLAEENEKTYQKQLENYNEVTTLWEDVYYHISTTDQTSAVDGYLKRLTDEQKRLTELASDIDKDYKAGNSVDKNKTIVDGLKDVKGKIEEIRDEQNGGYNNQIHIDNKTRMEAFDAAVKSARDTYSDALNKIVAFSQLPEEYASVIKDVVDAANASISGCLQRIRQTETEAKDAYNKAEEDEKDYQPFDEAETFKAEIVAIQGEIEAAVEKMNKDVDGEARVYFNDKIAEQELLLNADIQALKDANYTQKVIDDAFKNVREIIDNAKKTEEESDYLALAISEHLEKLATVEGLLETGREGVALAEWKAESKRVSELKDKQLEDLNKWAYPGDTEGTTKQNFITRYEQAVTDYFDKAVALRQESETLYGDVMAQLKNYLSDFENAVGDGEQVDGIYTEAKKLNANKDASDKAYAEYIAKVGDLQGSYDDAVVFAGKYAIDSYDRLVAIENSVNELRELMEKDKVAGACKNNEQLYDAMISNITADITAFKRNLNIEEQSTVLKNFNVLIADQNKAAEAVMGTDKAEEVDAYLDKITTYKGNFEKAIAPTGEIGKLDGDEDADKIQELYLAYDEQIAAWRTELAGYYNADLSNDTYQGLLTEAGKVQDACESLAGELGGMHQEVQDMFKADVDEVTKDIEAVIANIEARKENILFYEDKLQSDIQHVADEVAAIKADAEKEQAPHIVNQAAYERLNKEYDELVAKQKAMQDLIGTYEFYDESVHADLLANIEYMLEEDAKSIENRYAKCELTENSSLSFSGSIISAINKVTRGATQKEKAGIIANKVGIKVNEINSLLSSYKFQNAYELYNRIDNINAAQSNVASFNNDAVDGLISADIDGNKFVDEPSGAFVSKPVNYMEEAVPAIDAKIEELLQQLETLKADAEARKYILGDLDGDGAVLVNDYTTVIGYALGDAVPEEGSVSFLAADVNCDGQINIGDVTAVANLIMGVENNVSAGSYGKARAKVAVRRAVSTPESVEMEMNTEGGVKRVAIKLNNTNAYVGCQLDVQLPAGVTVLNETLGGRADDHEIYSNTMANGVHRMVISSMENRELTNSGEALVYLEVSGYNASKITVSNVLASNAGGMVYSIDGNGEGGTTGINGVQVEQGLKSKIYSVGGQVMDKLTRGINIIRNSDGSTKKVLKK